MIEAEEIYFDSGHEDHVHDIQWDYYARRLATASSDRTVKIFEVGEKSQELIATLTGHDGPVWQVAWAHPCFGNIVASCSYDGQVLIYTEKSGEGWQTVHKWNSGKSCSVNSIQFSPYEFGVLMLACASSDGYVTILMHTGQDNCWTTHRFAASQLGCNAVSWSPVGCIGCRIEGDEHEALRIATGTCDNAVRFWRAQPPAQGELSALPSNSLQFIEEQSQHNGLIHKEWVRDVAWSPYTGVATCLVVSCSEDKRVYIWAKNSPQEIWYPKLVSTFNAPVWKVSWSAAGNILAVSSGEDEVTLWKESMTHEWHKMGATSFDDEKEMNTQGDNNNHPASNLPPPPISGQPPPPPMPPQFQQ
mmetsp:Transcript_3124/g.4085  ORF Transcript_3124/g.4085 Transcript_3124/m.4085 type:complete len:360 (-) Transcript_3124:222-1301(-)